MLLHADSMIRSATVAVLLGCAVAATAQADPKQLAAMAEQRTVALLARHGAPDARDEDGTTMLFRAAERGDIFQVTAMLRASAGPSVTVRRWPRDGWSPLMVAAAGGHLEVVRQLLAAGAPVDQRNARGRTALMFAAFYGRFTVVSALLRAGADPDARDALELTPRLLATVSADESTLAILPPTDPQAAEEADPGPR